MAKMHEEATHLIVFSRELTDNEHEEVNASLPEGVRLLEAYTPTSIAVDLSDVSAEDVEDAVLNLMRASSLFVGVRTMHVDPVVALGEECGGVHPGGGVCPCVHLRSLLAKATEDEANALKSFVRTKAEEAFATGSQAGALHIMALVANAEAERGADDETPVGPTTRATLLH